MKKVRYLFFLFLKQDIKTVKKFDICKRKGGLGLSSKCP